ncbi:unnamed protein product [Rangifer tarandus platyrhynchus]|uniref:Uncharacterized protein n=1 Tax=Rangifer tarandus platyrhynchus TaxID=3082113 RepID=A0ABN8XM32_RANTA|nr:unnamed protein product [Rangifer tarandus platyrhynchus]
MFTYIRLRKNAHRGKSGNTYCVLTARHTAARKGGAYTRCTHPEKLSCRIPFPSGGIRLPRIVHSSYTDKARRLRFARHPLHAATKTPSPVCQVTCVAPGRIEVIVTCPHDNRCTRQHSLSCSVTT